MNAPFATEDYRAAIFAARAARRGQLLYPRLTIADDGTWCRQDAAGAPLRPIHPTTEAPRLATEKAA